MRSISSLEGDTEPPLHPSHTQGFGPITFEEVGSIGSRGVNSGAQVPRESPPQSADLHGCVVAHIGDGPHIIAAEGVSFPPGS